MFDLKSETFRIIKETCQNGFERQKWLGPEISELGLKFNGMDDVPLDSILILSALYVSEPKALTQDKLLDKTSVETAFFPYLIATIEEHGLIKDRNDIADWSLDSLFLDWIKMLEEYEFIEDIDQIGEWSLTPKGREASEYIFYIVFERKHFELKRSYEHINRLREKEQNA